MNTRNTPPGTTKQTVYFTMLLHPVKGWIRVGGAKATREDAKWWCRVIRNRWNPNRTRVSQFTFRLVDGVMDEKSKAVLNTKFNMDPPQ